MSLAPDPMELALRRRVHKRDAPPSFAERVAHRAAVPSVLGSSAFGEETGVRYISNCFTCCKTLNRTLG
ncbi:MAG: hypothetical protein ACOYL7_13375 [Caldilinea sp.]